MEVQEGNEVESEPMDTAASDPPRRHAAKVAIIADLNVDPPESDGEGSAVPRDSSTRGSHDEINLVKPTIVIKDSEIMDVEDGDQQCHGTSTSREEKVSSLKAGLIHVARKMPKNAHAHFLLGLMYQRLGQPQKSVLAFEKSAEILLQSEEEVRRPELLSLVQIHHAQCILLANVFENSEKELKSEELEDIITKLKESVHSDGRQAAVWNTLGLILLRTKRLQSAISVLSCLLAIVPDYLDCLANLGVAYLLSGSISLAEKCFQDLVLKDQNHPAAYINYAALLLSKYGPVVAGAGANAGAGGLFDVLEAANTAKQCLMTGLKTEPKAGLMWVNLADACDMAGDHLGAEKCLEQAAKLDSHQMSTRYAVALHRIKDAERYQNPSIQLAWAANEMASILKEGDPAVIDLPTAWAGLAMAHRAQHEISAAFETELKELTQSKERAFCSLKQVIEEDSDDAVSWHQLGLHNLCTLQFEAAKKFFKTAVACNKECIYAWSNLGISLQLSRDPMSADKVYKWALSLATPRQAHAILSNLGNLYREEKSLDYARTLLEKSLKLCPGYAPAHNNLGLVNVVEGRWEEARNCFIKATEMDPLLDAAKSNLAKVNSVCMQASALSTTGT